MALPVRIEKPKPKRGKQYPRRKQQFDGHMFDSLSEYNRYLVLKDMEASGEIHGLRVHPKFAFAVAGRPIVIRSKGYPNGRQVTWTPDFQYMRPGFGLVTEDVKAKKNRKGKSSTDTAYYRLKKAIFENLHWPAKVEEV